MNKKQARLVRKASAGKPFNIPASTEDVAKLNVDPTTQEILTPTATAALPARNIKTVAGTGASATFKGVGSMAEHGIPSGTRRNHFQDLVLAWNEDSGAHLDDDELAAIFDREFPFGGVRIAERPELVAVIRKQYNHGKHGKQQQGVPDVQSLQYGKPKAGSQATKGATAAAPVAQNDDVDDTVATGTDN